MTDEIFDPELTEDEKKLFEDLLAEDPDEVSGFGAQRRHFLKQLLAGAGGALALQLAGPPPLIAGDIHTAQPEVPPGVEHIVRVAFKVNGTSRSLQLDPRMTLLDVLREKLDLTGSKKGCDHGQCGACTVISDGRRVLSCLTLAASCEGRSITTIEGLAKDGQLHPMQSAFLKHDGFQCGFCTPGQICSAVAMLSEVKSGEASYVSPDLSTSLAAGPLTEDEIRERMSGNICRCGAYPNIVDAIREVHSGRNVAQHWHFVEQSS